MARAERWHKRPRFAVGDQRSAAAEAAMRYCDGEKCKGSVPAWPVHLTSHTSGFLRQINGVPLDALPIVIRVVGGEIAVDETEAALAALLRPGDEVEQGKQERSGE